MKQHPRVVRGIGQDQTGSRVEIVATVWPPEQDLEFGDWSCVVRCAVLFTGEKRIVGAHAQQAASLAETFVLEMFEHHRIDPKR